VPEAFAVVLGLSPTGLYAVRELGEAGVRVLGVESSRQPGCYSKHLTVAPGFLLSVGDDETAASLLAVAEREGTRGVLIPASDAYIEFVVRNASRLAARYDFQQSYNAESYSAFVDKARFAELCRTHGVAAPAYHERDASALAGLADAVAYPCLIKPALIHAVKRHMKGAKVYIARDAQEFRAVARMVEPWGGVWLVQELIPGPESNITCYFGYFAKDGSARQAVTARKLRQFPPGFGSASLVRSERLDETRELSERFLKGAGFRGIGGVEYKLDERDGKLKVIEVNPRPELWAGLSHHAGKRAVLEAFRDLSGGKPVPERAQIDGVAWRYFLKDLYSRLFYAVKGKGFVLAAPSVAGKPIVRTVGPLLDWSDPLPVFGELFNYAVKAVTRVFR
jgi:predicted ATP-grasp superfamily ATP-dependent carboligase